MLKFDPGRNELDRALWGLRKRLYPIVLFSFVLNLLQLTPTLYMLQLTERVLTSRDETTLAALTFMVFFLYGITSILEWSRSHLLVRLGIRVDEALHDRVFESTFRNCLRQPGPTPSQPLNDLAALRQFLAGPGLIAFFDAPWIVLFLGVIIILHPVLGTISFFGALLLFGMTWLTERVTQKPLSEANQAWARTTAFAASSLRNAEVIAAMGMTDNVRGRWQERYGNVLGLQALASDRAGTIGTSTRLIRVGLQSLILGAGAWLAINGHLTAGGMFAGSILMGRMMSPVELGIANWKGFVAARDAYRRLSALLAAYPPRRETMDLPDPKGQVSVEHLVVAAPDGKTPIIKGINFSVAAGEVVAIIGTSASGKSTLARALVGVWPAHAGKVRLDGADIYEWDKRKLGPHIGYLPQDIELFNGTIAENIARFAKPDSEKVVAAAKLAGLHETFLRFPLGYDTPIGEGGGVLSAGQRQRVALARALYGDPKLIVLDEPNSNLDDAGDAALLHAIIDLANAGRTVFVITHRTNVVSVVDKILVLRDGQIAGFGPRDAVLASLRAKHPPRPVPSPLPKPAPDKPSA